jgi:tetratricopeptide (TPR) repeat protein
MRSADHRASGHHHARLAVLAFLVAGPLLLSGGTSVAAPEKTDKASHDRAQRAYQEALKLYKGGQYRAAIDKLTEARKLDPTATELPYNLGLLYEKVGDLDNAIKSFELFLNLETDEAEKERVRTIVQRLEGARAEIARNKPPPSAEPPPPPPATSSAPEPEAPPPPPPPPRKGRLDGLVYGTGGLAVAALVSGTAFGVRALLIRPESKTSQSQSLADIEDGNRKAHQSAVIADVSFAVAVASGGAAALLYFLRDARATPGPSSAAFISPMHGGVLTGWGGRF